MYNQYDAMNMNAQQRLQYMEQQQQRAYPPQQYQQMPAYNQQVQPIQQQIQNLVVDSIEQAKNMQMQLNTFYIFFNKLDKEMYTKRIDNDGNTEFKIYKEPEEKPVIDHQENYNNIMMKIEQLTQTLGSKENVTNADDGEPRDEQQPRGATVPTNDERKNTRTAKTNISKPV